MQIHRYETGQGEPSFREVALLADLYGQSLLRLAMVAGYCTGPAIGEEENRLTAMARILARTAAEGTVSSAVSLLHALILNESKGGKPF